MEITGKIGVGTASQISDLRFWFEANPDLCLGYDGSLDSVSEDISFCKLSRSEQFGRFRDLEIFIEAN